MRRSGMVLVTALTAIAAALSTANAAPVLPAPVSHYQTNVVEADWYCGWGRHLSRSGQCVRNRYAYYRPRAFSGAPYYRWHAPDDLVADQLNRRELPQDWRY